MGEQISNNGTQYYQQDRVYNTETISPALNACGEGLVPKVVDCVAMRGRNPENPSDRRKGIELEQRLEVNTEGIANTITTVQKDNMVLIRQATKDGVIPCRIGGGGGHELSRQPDTQRKSNRERRDKSDSDNGEYP
jgi:hypothetical protein